MNEDLIEKTAFCPGPGFGLWKFTTIPYGLTGVTQTCQRGLDKVFSNCKDCVENYVDDGIISNNMQSHIQDLRRVLGRLQAAGFTLCGSKSSFGLNSVSHLGFNYSSSGVTPATDKTQAIINWPVLTSAKEVRSFLGLANFYSCFIPQFADIAAPLTALTGSRTTFKWEQAQQSAFTVLQQALYNSEYWTIHNQMIALF